MCKQPLILASQSPRRRMLLEAAGWEFSVLAPDEQVEASAPTNQKPELLVVDLAKIKAQHVASQINQGLILAADTVAECEGKILGKPTDRGDAERMLRWMSGKRHRVLTGVCLWRRPDDRHCEFLETTVLQMDDLDSQALEMYLGSGEWEGKAGAFGYQDGLDWVHVVSGLESNVVGLPVERLEAWMDELR